MTEHPTYMVKTVNDFLQVPEDRRAMCLQEFTVWLAVAENARRLLDGIQAKWPDTFTWVDDDLHTMELSVSAGDEKIASLSGVMKGFT